jgi:hypothetical protein
MLRTVAGGRRPGSLARILRGASAAGLCAGIAAACSSKPITHTVGGGGPDVTARGGAAGSDGSAVGANIFENSCQSGVVSCDGDRAVPCAADDPTPVRDCAAEGFHCREPFGCIVCTPGEDSCSNGVTRLCNAQGTAFDEFECDTSQGMVCEADGCKGACSPGQLGSSYIGCDYYPTVTPNPVFSGFHFAVAVANQGNSPAHVLVTRGTNTVAERNVAAGELEMLPLPWVSELKGGDQDACQKPPPAGASRLVPQGAYRLRSDHPVSVYQFSPLEYQLSPTPTGCPLRNDCPGSPPRPTEGCLSFTNDASLLFPSNVLTGSYTTLSWPSTAAGQGFISVVGTRADTQITITGRGQFAAGGGVSASGDGVVVLGDGDVLQLMAEASPSQTFGSDISGTLISASAPVQVLAGSSCGFVPTATTQACDHMEHAMLPAETLGADYLVTFPAAPGSSSPHVVRILPVLPETQISFDHELPGVGQSVVRSPADGALLVGPIEEDFRVTADKPVLVAHYLQGQSSVHSGAGDPSMAIAVPLAQYRDNYIFSVSKTYDLNYVNIVAPSGATVLLDDVAVPASEFIAIGGTGYGVARHPLPDGQEVFRIKSSYAFGILVYGYGKFTSYMYPGGLDLRKIAFPIIR